MYVFLFPYFPVAFLQLIPSFQACRNHLNGLLQLPLRRQDDETVRNLIEVFSSVDD